MYEGISTGKNPNYGKKGELHQIADNRLGCVIKRDWMRNLKYIGSARLVIRDTKTGREIRPK